MLNLPENYFVEKFVSIMTALVWLFVTVVWLILGLFVWIPLVARSTILMSAAIPLEAFTEKKGYTDQAERFLSSTIEIYPKGFQIITKSIYTKTPGRGYWDFRNDWMIIFREFVTAAIFWGIIDYFFIKFIF